MTRIVPPLAILLGMLFGLTSPSQAEDAASFVRDFQTLAQRHCVECHGADHSEANFRVDTLSDDFADAEMLHRWGKVFDKVSRGEMPPPDSGRLTPAERTAMARPLEPLISSATLALQQRQGRVLLRRLNRAEYEYTLHDLLGVHVPLADLLPEDDLAEGFDKVSKALDISAAHLLRYQEAASVALRASVPVRPLEPSATVRKSGREIYEHLANARNSSARAMLDKSIQLQGNDLKVFVNAPQTTFSLSSALAPQAGRYKVRASLRAEGTEGNPLSVQCDYRELYGAKVLTSPLDDLERNRLRDVAPRGATVVELELEMQPRTLVMFTPHTLPRQRDFAGILAGKPLSQYTGPRLVVEWIELEGPLGKWPPEAYQRVYGDVPLKRGSVAKAEAEGRPLSSPSSNRNGWWHQDPLTLAPRDPQRDAERLMRAFLPRAFRRPVAEPLQRYYVTLVQNELRQGSSFTEALHAGYKAALCSPHFLYLVEPVVPSRGTQATALDDWAIAARLSYFLWSSLPDDVLTEAARRGELKQPEKLRAQVDRMLDDRKARRFTRHFAGQWFSLDQINATDPDPLLYGEFDDYLFWSMPQETEYFFEEMLRANRPVSEFTHSDWTFLNERLAKHYGIPGIGGSELRKVTLPPQSGRGGVLGHAAVHKVTADGTKTSPILRGIWVLEKIVGAPPPPPPPNIPAVEPDIRGSVTIREQLDKHRNIASCATCHQHIDPPGFALEEFDVIGGRRDFYRASGSSFPTVDLVNYPGRRVRRGPDVDPSGRLPGGKPFRNLDEYKKLLLTDRDQLARNVAEKLIIYGTGAEIDFADREVVEALVKQNRQEGYGFRSLLHGVIQSRVFLNK